MKSVAVLVGSLRAESINRRLAYALTELARDRLTLHIVNIDDIPMYNEDLWQSPPLSVIELKREILEADGVLFVTPEYNRYFPPVLMNAIDWGTRPWGSNSWQAKPATTIGLSPGASGAALAQNALRSMLLVCGMDVMGTPEVNLNFTKDFFDGSGQISNDNTRTFVLDWLERFTAWVEHRSQTARAAPRD